MFAQKTRALQDAHIAYRALFPWVGKLLDESDLATYDTFRHSATLSPNMLRENYHPSTVDFKGASIYRTSGTRTGQGRLVLWSNSDELRYLRNRKDVIEKFTAGLGRAKLAISDLGTGHAAATASTIFEQLGFGCRAIDFSLPISEHIEIISNYRPSVLFTMPMILERLIAGGWVNHGVDRLILLGDLAPQSWRAQIEDTLKLAPNCILDLYGSIEVGAIAYFEVNLGLYLLHDDLFAEVKEEGCDVHLTACGGDGELVLTSTSRQYFPVIRYCTGDVVKGLCEIEHQGRRRQAVHEIVGRTGSHYKHGEKISQKDLACVVQETFGAKPFTVTENLGLGISVVTDQITEEDLQTFREKLKKYAPDVCQMIESGLVHDIQIRSIEDKDLIMSRGKRKL